MPDESSENLPQRACRKEKGDVLKTVLTAMAVVLMAVPPVIARDWNSYEEEKLREKREEQQENKRQEESDRKQARHSGGTGRKG